MKKVTQLLENNNDLLILKNLISDFTNSHTFEQDLQKMIIYGNYKDISNSSVMFDKTYTQQNALDVRDYGMLTGFVKTGEVDITFRWNDADDRATVSINFELRDIENTISTFSTLYITNDMGKTWSKNI